MLCHHLPVMREEGGGVSWALCWGVIFSVLRYVCLRGEDGLVLGLIAWWGEGYVDGYFSVEGAHVSMAFLSAMIRRLEVFAFDIDGLPLRLICASFI